MAAFKTHSASAWLARTSYITAKIVEDPEILYKACLEYFQWAKENPIMEDRVNFAFGIATHEAVEHPRAMTVQGLSMFLGISAKTWYEWRKNREDLQTVIEWAESAIFEQKLAAAAAGLLDGRLLAREMGLADKQIQEMAVPKMTIAPPSGEPQPMPPINE